MAEDCDHNTLMLYEIAYQLAVANERKEARRRHGATRASLAKNAPCSR